MAISLGDINFALGADTSALAQSLNRLRAFGREVERVSRSQADGAEKTATAYRKQEAAIASAINKTLAMNAALRRAGADASVIDKNNDILSRYANQLSNGAVKALTFQRANIRLNASLAESNRILQDLKQNRADQQVGRLTQAMQALASVAVLSNGPLGGIASRMTALGTLFSRLGGPMGLVVAGLAAVGIGFGKLAAASAFC